MSAPVPPVDLFFGDDVKVRLSFTHNDEIFAVEAVYLHDTDRTYSLVLKGNPSLDEDSPETGQKKRSTVDLTGGFDGTQIAGLYGVERLVFSTLAGDVFHDDAFVKEIPWPVLKLHTSTHTVWDFKIEVNPSD